MANPVLMPAPDAVMVLPQGTTLTGQLITELAEMEALTGQEQLVGVQDAAGLPLGRALPVRVLREDVAQVAAEAIASTVVSEAGRVARETVDASVEGLQEIARQAATPAAQEAAREEVAPSVAAAAESAGQAEAAKQSAEAAQQRTEAAAQSTEAAVLNAAPQRPSVAALVAAWSAVGAGEGALGVVFTIGPEEGVYRLQDGLPVRTGDTERQKKAFALAEAQRTSTAARALPVLGMVAPDVVTDNLWEVTDPAGRPLLDIGEDLTLGMAGVLLRGDLMSLEDYSWGLRTEAGKWLISGEDDGTAGVAALLLYGQQLAPMSVADDELPLLEDQDGHAPLRWQEGGWLGLHIGDSQIRRVTLAPMQVSFPQGFVTPDERVVLGIHDNATVEARLSPDARDDLQADSYLPPETLRGIAAFNVRRHRNSRLIVGTVQDSTGRAYDVVQLADQYDLQTLADSASPLVLLINYGQSNNGVQGGPLLGPIPQPQFPHHFLMLGDPSYWPQAYA
ncbi:hypothetical protein, partial [Teichococcus aestuarii]|uniref:hypothetical protein n=1 Tax=Teichococcus aestuarii TaxID=568898 RepID=UPI00361B59CA